MAGPWQRLEESIGGRKKSGTQQAEQRQLDNSDAAFNETSGVLGQMKSADDAYKANLEGLASNYKQTRDSNISRYTGAERSNNTTYQTARNTSMANQLAGDKAATDRYRAARNPVYEKYQTQLQGFSDEAAKQASDATTTYKNNIQPRLQDIMSTAQSEAGGAMSLKDAGDPNNSVNRAWRDMYESQAQGVGKQALADVGVMNSLGAQATANQLGGMGGAIGTNQLLALQGQNMGQSGQAYARAQQQMQGLRDQGLEVGRQESSNQYNRGQAAKDRYAGSVRDFSDADAGYQDRQTGYRQERGGYADRGFEIGRQRTGEDYDIDQNRVGLEADLSRGAAKDDLDLGRRQSGLEFDLGDRAAQENMGLSTGLAGVSHQLGSDQSGRDIANINTRYGKQSAVDQARAGMGYAQQAGGSGLLAGLAGAGAKMYAASGDGGGGAEGGTGAAAAAPAAGNYNTGQRWGNYTDQDLKRSNKAGAR